MIDINKIPLKQLQLMSDALFSIGMQFVGISYNDLTKLERNTVRQLIKSNILAVTADENATIVYNPGPWSLVPCPH